MQKATNSASKTTLATVYTGPLGRHLQKQEVATKQATLQAMRANIMELVAEPYLFSEVERLRTNDSVYQCECVAQLQRWFRNVYREYTKRNEGSLALAA